MNYFEHHIGDYDQATAHLTGCEDGMYHRLIRWYMASEQPLPADIKQIQRRVRAHSRDEKAAVQTVLAEFFELKEDGYHQHRCDEEIARYHEAAPDREAKKENERERQRRTRERRKVLFDMLRDHGTVPAFDTPMSELQRLVSQLESRGKSQPVTRPVTRDDTATHTHFPDTSLKTKNPERGSSLPLSLPPREPEPDAQPTPGGLACRAIKAAGIADVNPGHPGLLRLLQAGVTAEDLATTATELAGKGKGKFALLLATVEGRLKDAAAAGAVPVAAVRKDDWRGNDRSLRRMALQLAVPSYPDDTIDVFERRVVKAWRSAGEPALQPSEAQAA